MDAWPRFEEVGEWEFPLENQCFCDFLSIKLRYRRGLSAKKSSNGVDFQGGVPTFFAFQGEAGHVNVGIPQEEC